MLERSDEINHRSIVGHRPCTQLSQTHFIDFFLIMACNVRGTTFTFSTRLESSTIFLRQYNIILLRATNTTRIFGVPRGVWEIIISYYLACVRIWLQFSSLKLLSFCFCELEGLIPFFSSGGGHYNTGSWQMCEFSVAAWPAFGNSSSGEGTA